MTTTVTSIAALYLRFALRTIRWTLDCAPSELALLASQSVILAFWHERLLLMPVVWRLSRRAGGEPDTYPKVNILISRHHDGQLIARVMAHFGGRAIHGSSAREKDGRLTERGGAAAIRRLAVLLGQGGHVVVTPDGPRGPPRAAKPGLARLAILSGRPILPCAAFSHPNLRLPTWDRLLIPLPFGRGVVRLGPPITVRRGETPPIEAALDDALARAGLR